MWTHFILFYSYTISQIIDNDFGLLLIIICIGTFISFVLERFRRVDTIIIIVTKKKKRKSRTMYSDGSTDPLKTNNLFIYYNKVIQLLNASIKRIKCKPIIIDSNLVYFFRYQKRAKVIAINNNGNFIFL